MTHFCSFLYHPKDTPLSHAGSVQIARQRSGGCRIRPKRAQRPARTRQRKCHPRPQHRFGRHHLGVTKESTWSPTQPLPWYCILTGPAQSSVQPPPPPFSPDLADCGTVHRSEGRQRAPLVACQWAQGPLLQKPRCLRRWLSTDPCGGTWPEIGVRGVDGSRQTPFASIEIRLGSILSARWLAEWPATRFGG